MSEEKKGFIIVFFSFVFWGLFPIYFSELSLVNSFEVLAHRIFWSFVFYGLLLIYLKKINLVKEYFSNKKLLFNLCLSSFFISANWLIFIYAVSISNILETSLGYFISPLVIIIFGFIFLKEKLSLFRKLSVVIAFIAFLFEVYIFGSIPLISLSLAITFAIYGLIRKKSVAIEPIPTLFIETAFLTPFALLYLFYTFATGSISFMHKGLYIDILLVLSGIVSLLPLLGFNYSVSRLSLNTIGFLQYLVPIISFLIAIFIYNEPLKITKLITFIIIWIALLVFSLESLKKKT